MFASAICLVDVAALEAAGSAGSSALRCDTLPVVKMFHGTQFGSPPPGMAERQTGVPAGTPATPPTAGLAMTSIERCRRVTEKSLK